MNWYVIARYVFILISTDAQITATVQNQTLQAYEVLYVVFIDLDHVRYYIILQLFLEQIVTSCSNLLHINDSVFSSPIEVSLHCQSVG